MNSSDPLISIVMTAFNTASYLHEALKAVIDQDYQNWELLVADDASTDNSREIIDQFADKDPRIKPSHNYKNCHYLRTRNRLFGLAKGRYITFLDSDDSMTNDRIRKQLRFMEVNPELALCGCFVKYVDKDGRRLNVRHQVPPTDPESIHSLLPELNPITGSTIFIKSEILYEFNGYRDYFHGLCSEDYDLVARISAEYPCANLNRELYIYRQFEGSTSRAERTSNFKKKFSGEIVRFLLQQRQSGKLDALQRGANEEIDRFVERLAKPYRNDPSRFYIDLVSSHLSVGMRGSALLAAARAIASNPRRGYNYRTFFYVLKQWI